MTSKSQSLVEEARRWPRDSFGEGRLFNELADEIERLTQEIAQCIQDMLDPLGVGVIAEAQHLCMMMRGVEKQHSGTVTSTMLGAFRKNRETRNEFLSLVRK